MTEKRGRGRPSFKPTAYQRRTVAIAAGGGMTHEEIALGMGIHRDTLAKHFQHELSVGAYEKRLEVVRAMHAAAKKGSVTAAKTYLQLVPKAAAPPLEPAATPASPKPEPVGKKEQANLDAKTAPHGTEWAALLTPPAQPVPVH